MAIAFNLPSERPAPPEESYSRLNRLLAELYDVLCHILVTRESPPSTGRGDQTATGLGDQIATGTRTTRDPMATPDLRGECPRATDSHNAPPYHLRCNSTYIVNLVMVVAILKVSLASSTFNAIR